MNAAAPYLSINPTRETCIFFGSGVYSQRIHHQQNSLQTTTEGILETYRIVTIFKHPKDILHNNIILHFDKLGNLFSNPGTEDGDVDFAEIDFFREMFREFGGFDAGKFFIFEPLFKLRLARVKQEKMKDAQSLEGRLCPAYQCLPW